MSSALFSYEVPVGAMVPPEDRGDFHPATQAQESGSFSDWGVALYDFEQTQYLFGVCPIPEDYTGSSITIRLTWKSVSAGGSVRWGVLNTGSGEEGAVWDVEFESSSEVTAPVPGVAGTITRTSISLSGVSEYLPGGTLLFGVYRNASHSQDTLAENAQLVGILVRFDVQVSSVTLSGVKEELIDADDFSFADGLSSFTLDQSAINDIEWAGLKGLYIDGVRLSTFGTPLKHVTGDPAADGEWQISGNVLRVYGDIRDSGAKLHVTYPV